MEDEEDKTLWEQEQEEFLECYDKVIGDHLVEQEMLPPDEREYWFSSLAEREAFEGEDFTL